MQFIWWLTGVLAIITGCRFVLMVFKKVTSKENMASVIDHAQQGMMNAADSAANYFKSKKKKNDNQPIVTIH